MRRVSQLITQIRRSTENEVPAGSTGGTDGISDEEIIQYINDGQERIRSLVIKTHQKVFTLQRIISVTNGIEEYTLPRDIYLNHELVSVEFSDSGQAEDFYILPRRDLVERQSIKGFPSFYIARRDKILINPIPNLNGSVRFNYNPRPPSLDKRRATVATVTLDVPNLQITTLTLDTTAPFNVNDYLLYDHITVVDSDGNIQMPGISFDSVTAGGVVNVKSNFLFESGDTIAVGDYVVLGKYATTNNEELPQTIEKYLLAYAQWKLLKRDSSQDSTEQAQELAAMEQDIVDSFAEVSSDFDSVPIINFDFFWG